jgi:CheY-like chemotaxis protein
VSTMRFSDISMHRLTHVDVVNQRVLQTQLKTCGFSVHVANNGLESLHFVRKSRLWWDKAETGQPLSLVLMDIEMPIMNGLEATQKIREFRTEGLITQHIPIIAITANARNEQIAIAKQSGMDEVVSKPFRIPDLVSKIELFLGRLATKTGTTDKGTLKRRWSK